MICMERGKFLKNSMRTAGVALMGAGILPSAHAAGMPEGQHEFKLK